MRGREEEREGGSCSIHGKKPGYEKLLQDQVLSFHMGSMLLAWFACQSTEVKIREDKFTMSSVVLKWGVID